MGGMSVITEAYAHQTVSDSHHSSINTKGSGSASVPVINMKTPTVTESETAYYAVSLNSKLNARTVCYVVCYLSTLLQSLTLTDDRIQCESLVTKLRFSDRNAVNLLASVPFSTRLLPPPLQGRGVTF